MRNLIPLRQFDEPHRFIKIILGQPTNLNRRCCIHKIWLGHEHDLADVAARFDISVRRAHLLEGK